MAVRIVTDSASALLDKDMERLDIASVPIGVIDGDGRIPEPDLRSAAFYERLAQMRDLPTTSQPSPEEFEVVFRRLVAEGHDVLAILISGGMSGTVRSAEIAATDVREKLPDARIEILDSGSNSLQEGFAVLAAAEQAHSGGSMESCVSAAAQTVRRTRFLFTPHSLEYLKRGGRISGASALVGVLLKIDPILTAEKGVTAVAAVARGTRAARKKVAALMRRDIERCGLRRAIVQYVMDIEEARRFAAEAIEPVVGHGVPIVPIHPVVGLHVGPAVGVVYETETPLR